MLDPIHINGELPALIGLPCEELFVQQHWHKGELSEPANQIHLRFEDLSSKKTDKRSRL